MLPVPINRIVLNYVTKQEDIIRNLSDISIDTIKWFNDVWKVEKEIYIKNSCFLDACLHNRIDVLIWLNDELGLLWDDCLGPGNFDGICTKSSIDTVKYIKWKFPEVVSREWSSAFVMSGHYHKEDMVIILLSDFNKDQIRKHVISICSYGLIEVMKWFKSKFGLCIDDFPMKHSYESPSEQNKRIGAIIREVEQLDVDHEMLQENKDDDSISTWSEIIDTICMHGKSDLLKWIDNEINLDVIVYSKIQKSPFVIACENDELETAKWVKERFKMTREQCMDANNYAFTNACERGSLKTVKWLKEELKLTIAECSTDDNYGIKNAIENGHDDIVKYLINVIGIQYIPDEN